ncbi:3-oxoacyl-[acyl-carrier-protein] synthase III C-terminal domain-containing protein [Streptomyces shenzhenensis]|uniref:Beta-ketoacyl-[acyl-carrier-protein] synthase III C-terminal domain-containing protein n=1 Tax=Streptomyces shenzhenensis TaxID=943815 RepID=A0A3M0I8X0_9ACTN|nr:3-oxoacyl-[acyl-carrier-protein] synthase III C-terminal domain-containing protein [Streptomyces shenzhenensis]RMB84772.1 hypothetical protein CTZ28_16595 [Streptomyces shenzhenensis]
MRIAPPGARRARFRSGAVHHHVRASGLQQLADVDRFVIHQANTHILKALGELLDIPFERMATNIQHVGNTSAVWPELPYVP